MTGPKISIKMSGRRGAQNVAVIDGILRSVPGELVIGIPPRSRYYRFRKKPVSVFRVAMWNEYGAPGVPARPAVTTTVNAKADKYRRSIRARMGAHMSKSRPNRAGFAKSMQRLGDMIVADIRAGILAYVSPPSGGNAESTVKKKRSRGVSPPNNPLVETGRYANAFVARWYDSKPPRSAGAKRLMKAVRQFNGTVGAK